MGFEGIGQQTQVLCVALVNHVQILGQPGCAMRGCRGVPDDDEKDTCFGQRRQDRTKVDHCLGAPSTGCAKLVSLSLQLHELHEPLLDGQGQVALDQGAIDIASNASTMGSRVSSRISPG